MAESITLQTSDNNVQQSDVLGRLSFAASNESSASDARLIAASIYAVAESDFTEISNATSLIFATASSESASEVMRITSVGDVGVGTSSPSSKLEIVGDGGTSDSGILTISDPNGGSTTSWIKLYADDGFDDLTWHISYTDTSIFKALEFRTAFNNVPEVTIEPSGEFWVLSDKSVYTYRYLSDKTSFNTSSQPAYSWSMDDDTGMFSPTGNAIAFSAGGIERMRIDSDQVVVNSGNIIFNEIGGHFDFRVEGDSDENLLSVDASLDRVGIGILVPQAKLDVRGSFLANNVVTLGSGSIPLPRRPIEILNHTNIDQLSIRLRQNAQGNWVSGYSFPTVAGLSGQALVADSSGVVSWSSVALGSGISNYVPKWINSTTLTSGLIYDDGNHIGIGNNPNGHLDSFSTYGPSLVLGNGSGDVGQFFYSTNNASIWFTNGTELNNLRGQITYLHSEDKLAFGTSGVGISMALDANGNLGIGQNYPSARLNVEGGNIVFNDLGGNFDFRVEGDTDQNLLFVDASTDRVGIGTSSPSSKLHVNGPITVTAGNAGAPSFTFVDDSDIGIYRAGVNSLAFSTSGVERIRIGPDGEVGIGMTGSSTIGLRILHDANANNIVGSVLNVQMPASALTSYGYWTAPSLLAENTAYTTHIHYIANPISSIPSGSSAGTEVGFQFGNSIQQHTVRGFTSFLNTLSGYERYAFLAGGSAPSLFNGVVWFANGSNSAPSIAFSSDTDTGLFYPTANNLAITTGGTERLRINSNGDVGIGTSSPTHKLHVAGSGYMDWTQLQSNYYINYPIPGSIAGNSNRDQIILFAQNGVATLFRGYIDSNSTATSNEYLRNFSRTFIHYRTSATVDTVPQVTVNGVYNGNQSDLAANDNGRVVKVLHNGIEYWGLIMQDLAAFQNPGAPVFNGYASSLANLQYGHRDGFTTVTDITPNTTAGRSASLFRYQNLSVPDGNVGVGTNNPTSRLHVEGGNVVFNDAGGNFDFRVEGDTDANLLFVDASNDSINIGTGSSTGSKLYVSTNSATNYSSILASGAAGSQSSLIRVSNINNSINDSLAGLFISVRQPSTSTDQSAFISCLSSTEHVHTPHIVFGSRSGSSTFQELMRISSSGNLGIGTNSPSSKLHVVGSTSLIGPITEGYNNAGNTGTAQTIALTNGTIQNYTLTGNCTFTMPTATAGQSFTVMLRTGAGSFTSTFTNVKWPNNTAPTITTTASRMDLITFISDGTNWYGTFAQNYTV